MCSLWVQQRGHFGASLAATFTLTPLNSSPARPSPSPSATVTFETMKSAASGMSLILSKAAFASPETKSVTSASSGLPMVFSPRASSSALLTSSRRAMRSSKRSLSAASNAHAGFTFGMSLSMTCFGFMDWSCFISSQISFEVNARIGAMRRTMALWIS